MHNKGRKNLHKYLTQASSAEDVVNNHAYGKVARSHRPIPQRRSPGGSHKGTVAGYRDSMVGSINQYRSVAPKTAEPAAGRDVSGEGIIGNRPRSGVSDVPKSKDASLERRHHFIEPPKRGFNRFG